MKILSVEVEFFMRIERWDRGGRTYITKLMFALRNSAKAVRKIKISQPILANICRTLNKKGIFGVLGKIELICNILSVLSNICFTIPHFSPKNLTQINRDTKEIVIFNLFCTCVQFAV